MVAQPFELSDGANEAHAFKRRVLRTHAAVDIHASPVVELTVHMHIEPVDGVPDEGHQMTPSDDAIRCHQVPSGAIRCHQVPSTVVKSHQEPSKAVGSTPVAISCHRLQSRAIKSVQEQSGVPQLVLQRVDVVDGAGAGIGHQSSGARDAP